MPTRRDDWQRVSAQHPCPICDHPDNCTIATDGSRVWCGRIAEGSVAGPNNGGQYLHRLTDDAHARPRRITPPKPKPAQSADSTDWGKRAAELAAGEHAETKRGELADVLGVSAAALEALGVGWSDRGDGYWTFPERDGAGQVVGINRRFAEGAKKSLGKRGLTYSGDWAEPTGPVLIVEGGSDTAAAITLGLSGIGRPSCTGGAEHLVELLRTLPADRDLIVLGEFDPKPDGSWPGRDGAISIARQLAERLRRPVKWALPPDGAKDLRAWLQSHGAERDLFVEALDPQELSAGETDAPTDAAPSQATQLVRLAIGRGIELFRSPDGDGYALFPVGDHVETHRVNGTGLREWLRRAYYETFGRVCAAQALQDALGTLAGEAQFGGRECPVAVRVADHDGAIWLDLADERWRAVRITPRGWSIVPDPPVRFVRPKGMLSLPEPIAGGKLDALRPMVNVAGDDDWLLLVAWLVQALRPVGPYPILAIHGEQGSAKSTTCRILRRLIDPCIAELRSEPRAERDLVIYASRVRIVALENLSTVTPWLSDALCRLATGGGFGTRELHTDRDEVLFDVTRPVLLNGIPELATRADLADRTIAVELPAISEHNRRAEAELWAEYQAIRPGVLGALLDCAAAALRGIDAVRLNRLPRMADFARWATAAEPAIGCGQGAFVRAYGDARARSTDTAIEAAPIGPAVLGLMRGRNEWSGTASELLAELRDLAGEPATKERGWPKQGNKLSEALRRIAPSLRAVGIDARQGEGRQKRIWTLSTVTIATTVTHREFSGESSEGGPSPGPPPIAADRHHRTAQNPAQTGPGGDGDDGDDQSHLFSPAEEMETWTG